MRFKRFLGKRESFNDKSIGDVAEWPVFFDLNAHVNRVNSVCVCVCVCVSVCNRTISENWGLRGQQVTES